MNAFWRTVGRPMRQDAFHLKKGTQVNFVGSDAERTEIPYKREHLLAEQTAGVDV